MGAAAAPVFLGEGEDDNAKGDRAREVRTGRHLAAVGARPGEAEGRRLTVLVVEDDPSMQLLCSYNLEAAGFRVLTAKTGHEGVTLASAEKPDLVLLDVMLPDLGGFEVAERLRGVPIVFLSARASESDMKRGRAAGAIDYVTKPFDPVTLPDRLRDDLEELRRGGGAERVWASRFGPGSDPAE
jgi:two-component system, OmpR family, alkaline phosphatase synthesis response regulator PhoP